MTTPTTLNQDSPSNRPFGAQIVHYGITDRGLFLIVVLPLTAALVLAIMAMNGQGETRAAMERAAGDQRAAIERAAGDYRAQLERTNGDMRETNARLEGKVAELAAEAKAAKELAQISERNAKLAQYQLKLALDRAKIEVPDDLTENDK